MQSLSSNLSHPARAWRIACGAMLVMMLGACAIDPKSPEATILADTAPAYDYPINNPYAATVITMPKSDKVDLTDLPTPEDETITIFPNRKVPEGFWYERGLRYGQLLQKGPAPLIYVIAGTGADHKADKMQALARMFYAAGFHTVLLPSPTNPNFIINASNDFKSVRPIDSAPDIYRVMQAIDAKLSKETKITKRMLTGYSLGAMDAAFTANYDGLQKQLNFSRILLINPPYDLNHSIKRLDQMLYAGMPGGMDDADYFIQKIMVRLGSLSTSGDALDFDNERLLLDAYQQDKLDTASLSTTIGLSFRLSAANMIFASDVMSRRGYIFPKDSEFNTTTNLDRVMAIALRTSYVDFANEYYAAEMRASRRSSMNEDSLEFLASYIKHNPKFGLISNRDDVILEPGEEDKMAALFAGHAHIFPNGGHLGNMTHPAVSYAIVNFMQHGGQP